MSNTKETRKGLKRKFISLEKKIQILNRLEGGEKISSVAKSTNLNESTIRTLKKNADNIRKTVADCCPIGAKRVTRTRNSNMVKMERALMIWLEDCIAKKIPISGNLIKQKALKIYEHLRNIGHSYAGLENQSVVASKGWFEKLKKRYTLHNIKFQGEQASADVEAAENYKLELARIINEGGYSPDQIFKADETALYWKKLPSRTFISKNQRRAQGFKPSKERITLHVCSNLSGSLMIKPMIINRSSTPRVMKNINKSQLPVFWRFNKKAWMTQDLFKDSFYNCFIPAVETYTMEKNLYFKVLLVIDNASCHNIELDHPNVKIVFLPPNCTSLIQPLDQGVIQTLKMYYARQLFQTIFDRLENDCIRTVSSACAEIKPSTLNACWKALLPQMVQAIQDDSTISLPVTEIVNIASRLNDEEFAVNHQDVRELVLGEETLDEEELMELIDGHTSNALVNENKENEWVPKLDLQDVKKGLNLAKELELHFIETDHSTVRSAKFKRELRICLAPSREILVELEKKATIQNQCEDQPSEEDILPIKRRRVKRLISDSEDEC
ncbi:tigger transposable element-derived protein 1-like [Diachasmimorpha longicaudata]|uniref:tigger transposable element-derived protein 1-like n=1 Tax=Diachasmimorpha longicaudata TaxID=58733 RepID=UPI0030B8AAF1